MNRDSSRDMATRGNRSRDRPQCICRAPRWIAMRNSGRIRYATRALDSCRTVPPQVTVHTIPHLVTHDAILLSTLRQTFCQSLPRTLAEIASGVCMDLSEHCMLWCAAAILLVLSTLCVSCASTDFDVVALAVRSTCVSEMAVHALNAHLPVKAVHIITPSADDCLGFEAIAANVKCYIEESLLPPLSRGTVEEVLHGSLQDEVSRKVATARAGWYLQQLLKLGAALAIKDLTEHFLVRRRRSPSVPYLMICSAHCMCLPAYAGACWPELTSAAAGPCCRDRQCSCCLICRKAALVCRFGTWT